MRPGTPGFLPARLRQIREARGLTMTSLAGLIQVSRAAISQYENGAVTPDPGRLERIAEVLAVPVYFFWHAIPEKEVSVTFFRSMAAVTKAARASASQKCEWLLEIVDFVEKFVDLPLPRFPMLNLPHPLALSSADIEDAASALRAFWGLGDGPISNIVRLLERNGTIVTRFSFGASGLDSLHTWYRGRPYIAINADKTSAVRCRFDAGHELGHIVLHRTLTQPEVNTPENFKLLEDQAHEFSTAFLLPFRPFARDFLTPTLETLRLLKGKWLASIQAMLVRASRLGLLQKEQADHLWASMSYRQWRKEEPLDDTLPVEQPELLRRGFTLILDSGIQSKADITQSLPFGAYEIEELAVLPEGFLAEPQTNVKLRGNVVPFPRRT